MPKLTRLMITSESKLFRNAGSPTQRYVKGKFLPEASTTQQ